MTAVEKIIFSQPPEVLPCALGKDFQTIDLSEISLPSLPMKVFLGTFILHEDWLQVWTGHQCQWKFQACIQGEGWGSTLTRTEKAKPRPCCSVAEHVWIFEIPWTAACQASLTFIISLSLLKFMSIELVMPSNHFILCYSASSAISLSQHQGLLKWVSSSHQVAKILEFQLQHQSFKCTPRTGLL